MKSRPALKRKIIKLLDSAIQGGLSETTRTCGNKTCACHADPAKRHGPNLYLTFRKSDGKSSGLYIPRAYEKQIRKAVLDWSNLWDALVAYAALNREDLRTTMRRTPRETTNG
jgi:hypothetical protein